MKRKTRVVSLTALFSALTVICLYFTSIWPTGVFGFVAFASLLVAAAVCDAGVFSGVYVYIVSSALGLLLVPNKAAPILYIAFFGYYPVVKSLIERINGTFVQWVLKLLVLNAALTVIWFLLRALIFDLQGTVPGILPVYAGSNAVFILFDVGFSKLIGFYISNISKYMRKN